jgi:hypothetical protein
MEAKKEVNEGKFGNNLLHDKHSLKPGRRASIYA